MLRLLFLVSHDCRLVFSRLAEFTPSEAEGPCARMTGQAI